MQYLHHLNTGYTNYFNAKTGRAGHLFQGRVSGNLRERIWWERIWCQVYTIHRCHP